MPLPYLLTHLALAALCFWLAARLPSRSPAYIALAVVVVTLTAAGFVIERAPELAWSAMLIGWPDAVFFSNFSLAGVAVMLPALWQAAGTKAARARAILLGGVLTGAAFWSLAWYFAPPPAALTNVVDETGYCAQSSQESCSAAAATMLLDRRGVSVTEAEMGRLCLTRARFGTPTLGLYRGVSLKARQAGLRARMKVVNPRELTTIPTPCIASVGILPSAPAEERARLEGYGWSPSGRHAVLIDSVDAKTGKLKVADPSFGVESWPAAGIEWIWDGRALTLE